MIKLLNKKVPEEKWISSNKTEICYILSILFCLLIIIYFAKIESFSFFDIVNIYSMMLIQLLAMYSCFIRWDADLLMYNHYLFVIMIFLVIVFSNNIWLLGYYLAILIYIIIGWRLKKRCIFDNLCWDIECCGYRYENTEDCTESIVYMLLAVFPLKMCYLNK